MEPKGSLPHSQWPDTCPSLNLVDPVHARTSHFLKIHLNIILPSMPGSPVVSFSPVSPPKTLHTPLLSPTRATWPALHILLDFITRTILGEEYRSLSSSLGSFLHSLVTSSPLGPNILVNTLFSNTLSLHFSVNLSDQVSRPYKTTGKIIVIYISVFKSVDIKLEDKRLCTE